MDNKDFDKIDIVYCWVDGFEENYLKRKEALAKNLNVTLSRVNPACRVFNNDELKYSLRSLEKYAPWVNNVFIITNQQTPKWLNLSNPKVKLIEQADILPSDASPNFNPMAIEHCLRNIPGLSELFLYANDDNLIYDYISPEFFFKNKLPICRFHSKHTPNECLYYKTLNNAENLIFSKYNCKLEHRPHHNIEAYRKTDLIECYNTFKEEIDKTIYSPFRSEDNIEKHIYNLYAIANKKGYFKRVRKINTDLPFYKKLFNFLLKKYSKESIYISASDENILNTLEKFHPKLFCINDDEKTTQEDRENVKRVMETLFPEKSSFEI